MNVPCPGSIHALTDWEAKHHAHLPQSRSFCCHAMLLFTILYERTVRVVINNGCVGRGTNSGTTNASQSPAIIVTCLDRLHLSFQHRGYLLSPVVCYTAVLCVVTQRSSPQCALRDDACRSPEPHEGLTFISYFKTMSLGLHLAKPLFSGRDMLLHRRSLVFVGPALTTLFFRLFRQVST